VLHHCRRVEVRIAVVAAAAVRQGNQGQGNTRGHHHAHQKRLITSVAVHLNAGLRRGMRMAVSCRLRGQMQQHVLTHPPT
jgi:hypothetical protein